MQTTLRSTAAEKSVAVESARANRALGGGGGLHVTWDAHFQTWRSYSSQKSCVKIWFGLVEPFKSYHSTKKIKKKKKITQLKTVSFRKILLQVDNNNKKNINNNNNNNNNNKKPLGFD